MLVVNFSTKVLTLPTSEELQLLTKYIESLLSVRLFTSNETELDHYHYKLNVRVTSRVVKRLRK